MLDCPLPLKRSNSGATLPLCFAVRACVVDAALGCVVAAAL